jgi:very-short-patch-repair endonuclease
MRARDLRNNMSDAEVRLWARLKAGRRDAIRTTWLARRGYRVIRFWSTEVMCETDEVVDAILAALHGEDTLIEYAAGFRSE